LIGISDVQRPDLDPAGVFIRQIVQQGSSSPVAHRTDDAAPLFQELGRHRMAEVA
jgi:hypothetical protein